MPAPKLNLLKSLRKNPALGVGAGLVIVVILLAAAFHEPVKNQLNAWKLLPQPERLTELYFTHPNNLPAGYTAGKTQTVSFTVHNLEYRSTTYRYQIVEQSQDGSQSKQLAAGNFTLAQGQYARPVVNITPADLGPRVNVAIKLMSQNESIDYWVNRSGV